MSTRVEANLQELRTAARTHRKSADALVHGSEAEPSRSAVLLRFYGVESGMKAILMRREKLRTTNTIFEGAFGLNGHDLEVGMRSINVPAVVAKRPPVLRRKSAPKSTVSVLRSHEALRYGIDILREDLEQFDRWLVGILEWLGEEGVA